MIWYRHDLPFLKPAFFLYIWSFNMLMTILVKSLLVVESDFSLESWQVFYWLQGLCHSLLPLLPWEFLFSLGFDWIEVVQNIDPYDQCKLSVIFLFVWAHQLTFLCNSLQTFHAFLVFYGKTPRLWLESPVKFFKFTTNFLLTLLRFLRHFLFPRKR